MVDRVKQMWCGLHGHDALLQFEQDRMFLRCVSCGHETPGWNLNEAPPTVALQTETSAPLVQPQLISVRRVA
jgi:hypothetical protein